MKVTIVIPTMNEEASIGEVMDAVNETLKDVEGGYEVLVVDTDSKDRTREIASEKGASHK